MAGLSCSRCGQSVPKGTGLCPKCGSVIGSKCPICGGKVVAGGRFCGSCGSVLQEDVAVAGLQRDLNRMPTFPQVQYAGFWRRVAASFLDSIVLLIPYSILFVVLGRNNAYYVCCGIMGWLYFALTESSAAQATLGKRAVGIMVSDTSGGPISFGRATGRHFAKIISDFTFLIGYLMAAFTEKKQALHDMIAGCLVVKRGL